MMIDLPDPDSVLIAAHDKTVEVAEDGIYEWVGSRRIRLAHQSNIKLVKSNVLPNVILSANGEKRRAT